MYMNNVAELENICQKILKLDPKMRSARFINARGHLAAGGMRDGLLSLEAKKQDEMMIMELALRVRMRHEFDAEFGIVCKTEVDIFKDEGGLEMPQRKSFWM